MADKQAEREKKDNSLEAFKRLPISLDRFDAMGLMNDWKQFSGKGNDGASANKYLASTALGLCETKDPRKERESTPEAASSSAQPKSHDDEKNVALPEKVKFLASDEEATPHELASLVDVKDNKTVPSAHNTFDIASARSTLDPAKPTIAFLDNFSDVTFVFDGMGLSHGQVSALGAAKNGFNAVALNIAKSEGTYGANLLHDVSDTLREGKLPLSKGDVLNVSLNGVKNPTFDELNDKLKKFGFKVSPESLANDRDRLMQALQVIAKDGKDKVWQARAQEAVDSNKAVTEIQAAGIEVVNSAGNDGPNHVDLDFLAAAHRIGSVDPKTGLYDSFSERDGRTEPGNGVVEVRRQQESGQYKFGDVSVSAADLCKLNDFNCGWHTVEANALNFDTNPTTPSQANLDRVYKTMGRVAPAIDTVDGPLIALTSGTSYANISYLKSQLERLTLEKKVVGKRNP